jgi:hypothetical protein
VRLWSQARPTLASLLGVDGSSNSLHVVPVGDLYNVQCFRSEKQCMQNGCRSERYFISNIYPTVGLYSLYFGSEFGKEASRFRETLYKFLLRYSIDIYPNFSSCQRDNIGYT